MKMEIIQDTGYGLIPKKIMRNKELSITAKAIYSYLASFAGNTGKAFPSVNLIIGELNISRDTFYKYVNELKEKGAIQVKQTREQSKGTFKRNVYYLNNEIKPPCPKSPDTVAPDTVTPNTVNQDTISNSFKSNSFKSNNYNNSGGSFEELVLLYEQNGFGLINSYTKQELVDLVEDYSLDWVIDALKVAIDNNVRKIGYVKGTLQNWKTKGKNLDKPKKHEETENWRGSDRRL